MGSVVSNYTDYAGRVLLLHAGGYSQRLPSVSVVGKIFMGIPCGMLLTTILRKQCLCAMSYINISFTDLFQLKYE